MKTYSNNFFFITLSWAFLWHLIIFILFSWVFVIDISSNSVNKKSFTINYFNLEPRYVSYKVLMRKVHIPASHPTRDKIISPEHFCEENFKNMPEIEKQPILKGISFSNIFPKEELAQKVIDSSITSGITILSEDRTPILRRAIWIPPLPKYPKWAEKKVLQFDQELKIKVSPEGEVEEVITIKSTGYPEVDIIGSRFLRKWKFERESFQKEAKWYIVPLKFRLVEDKMFFIPLKK